tara:strand:- start:560 stop:721 length:162 start_codon:yes stop_codon:yes gene_type:complete
MQLSELIKHLQELEALHGECWVEDARGVLLSKSEVCHKPDDGAFDLVVIDADE